MIKASRGFGHEERSQSDVPRGPFLWSRSTAARETLRYLNRNGIDAEPLLLKVELVACETRVAGF